MCSFKRVKPRSTWVNNQSSILVTSRVDLSYEVQNGGTCTELKQKAN